MAMKPMPFAGKMAAPFGAKPGIKRKKKKSAAVASPAEEAAEGEPAPGRSMMATGLTRKAPMGSNY